MRDLLIIDDEDDKRSVIRKRMEDLFDKVNVASSFTEGLALTKSHFYEFIIMDINLPDADGMRAAGQIKEISPYSEIILATAYKRIDSAAELMKSNVVLAVIDTLDEMGMLPSLIELKRNFKKLLQHA